MKRWILCAAIMCLSGTASAGDSDYSITDALDTAGYIEQMAGYLGALIGGEEDVVAVIKEEHRVTRQLIEDSFERFIVNDAKGHMDNFEGSRGRILNSIDSIDRFLGEGYRLMAHFREYMERPGDDRYYLRASGIYLGLLTSQVYVLEQLQEKFGMGKDEKNELLKAAAYLFRSDLQSQKLPSYLRKSLKLKAQSFVEVLPAPGGNPWVPATRRQHRYRCSVDEGRGPVRLIRDEIWDNPSPHAFGRFRSTCDDAFHRLRYLPYEGTAALHEARAYIFAKTDHLILDDMTWEPNFGGRPNDVDHGPSDGGIELDWNDGGNATWAMNCDFEGDDVGNLQVAPELCSTACEREPGCTHFTWTDYVGGTCWLKRGSPAKDHAISGPAGAVCGIMYAALE